MTKDEAPARSALKLALEGAANYIDALGGDSRKYRQALAEQPAIKQDLTPEQPAQQEPVSFSCLRCVTPKKCAIYGCSPNTWPSETPPAQRQSHSDVKPLTDEQIMEMYNEPRSDAEMLEFARAIEAKLREKNSD